MFMMCVNAHVKYLEIPNYNVIDRKVIETLDILGRETTNKGFQLHIYDDGSVEKKYLMK